MKLAFSLDLERCSGCFACVVACMDQNDIETEIETAAFRQVFRIEKGQFPDAKISYISLACMHCEDAPCIIACPTGALRKAESTPSVVVEQDLCIGCHSCSLACPFGIPRFGADGKMQKCDLCEVRVRHGYDPACVRVCPTKALTYGDPNRLGQERERKAAAKLAGASLSRIL